MKKKVQTEVISYPCPNCGTYELPFMHSKDGYALMLCNKCKTQFKTSTKVSANFRKYCSKIASKPNRSPNYFTSSERKLRDILNELDMIEGLDYFHNSKLSLEGFIMPIDLYVRYRLFNCEEKSLCPIKIVKKSLPICENILRNIIREKKRIQSGKQKERNGLITGKEEIGINLKNIKNDGQLKIENILFNLKENGQKKIQQCDKVSIEKLCMKSSEINASVVKKLIGECSKSIIWVENLRKGRLFIPKMNGANCVFCVLTAIVWHIGLAKEVLINFRADIEPFININNRQVYYWLDFVISSKKIIIEINPSIWHKLWNRESSDKRKKELIEKLGWKYIGLNEKEINKLTKEDVRKWLN